MTSHVDGQVEAEPTIDDFDAWVAPHLRSMGLLAARLTSPDERDDVVQEALARAWSRRSTFDPTRGTPAGWLLAITADQARRTRTRRGMRIQMPAPTAPAPAAERDLDLEAALLRLTDRQRLAVDCVYFVGLSVAETAAVMHCAVGTVKSTLSDARARLRTLLEVRDGSDR
jgi:RNA polymerase sigma-70 factor (ECF subfamily)